MNKKEAEAMSGRIAKYYYIVGYGGEQNKN
jgi:hypothetical protein